MGVILKPMVLNPERQGDDDDDRHTDIRKKPANGCGALILSIDARAGRLCEDTTRAAWHRRFAFLGARHHEMNRPINALAEQPTGDDRYSDDDGDVDECVPCPHVGFQRRHGLPSRSGSGGGCALSNTSTFPRRARKPPPRTR